MRRFEMNTARKLKLAETLKLALSVGWVVWLLSGFKDGVVTALFVAVVLDIVQLTDE